MDIFYTMKHRRLLLLLAALLGLHQHHVAQALESCQAVKRQYARDGFKGNVTDRPIRGDHLKMCVGTMTCCTETMESKLSIGSRLEFDNNLKKNLNPLANLLDKKNTKFDEFFRNLLNYSRTSFDTMFVKTYGILYKQNAHVFTDLYDNLEDYYNKGQLDLQEAMNGFFKKLYQRMFAVYNSQYQFTPKYLRCITRHMEELQPFGDVPVKLTTQIKRSFVALRTFVQGLATGRDVVRNVLKINPSLPCIHELMKMSKCAMCAGELGVHPCKPYCLDVIDNCLAHHKPLVQHWHAYVDAMVQVGERLENPFNIENVVEPINYKVSDAIMNFQEAGHEISKKVFHGCGQPQLGGGMRNKRQVSAGEREISFESLDFSGSRQDSRDQNTDTIGHLVHEIKTKIKNSRNFWDELPTKMCSEARRQDDSNCWTGTAVGKYEAKDRKFLNNSSADNSQMNVQIMRLTVITEKLKEAYNGRDVSWINEEPWLTPSTDARIGGDPDFNEEEGSGGGYYRGSNAAFRDDDEEGSGGYRTKDTKENFPIDDEDGYGSGDDIEGPINRGTYGTMEGSGGHVIWEQPKHMIPKGNKPTSPYDDKTKTPNQGQPKEKIPSAAATKPMSLLQAISVFLLPAFVSFLGGSMG